MDAVESENGHLREKSVENYESLEKEARNVFPNGLPASTLKCSSSLNMHGKESVRSTNRWRIILAPDAANQNVETTLFNVAAWKAKETNT